MFQENLSKIKKFSWCWWVFVDMHVHLVKNCTSDMFLLMANMVTRVSFLFCTVEISLAFFWYVLSQFYHEKLLTATISFYFFCICIYICMTSGNMVFQYAFWSFSFLVCNTNLLPVLLLPCSRNKNCSFFSPVLSYF